MNTDQPAVTYNRIGWHAIQHKDGWWIGTAKGVTCYRTEELARAALTIIHEREGGGALHFRATPFTGANKIAGTHTPPKSFTQAIRTLKRRA